MTEDTRAKIDKLIHHHIRACHAVKLAPEQTLHGDLGGNDLDILQIVMDLEDDLDLEITDDEAENLKTVGNVYDLVDSKLKAHA